VAAQRQIVAIGGGTYDGAPADLLQRYVHDVIGKPRPRLAYLPTAIGDHESGVLWFYERHAPEADVTVVKTFPWPPEDLRAAILEQDGICVSGGNTANMLAIWKVHGIDELLREAWESGVVLFGQSAGMICWFDAGVTDSFGPKLDGMDCLGFLPGSACPHYDGEEQRRPRYHELVAAGFPEGIAADDGVALRYEGTELAEIVSAREGAAAYRVARSGEERLDARLLG
jgi:dipeptidase E